MKEDTGGRAAPYYMAALKQLKSQRGPTPPERLEQAKTDNRTEKAVLKALATAKTVPEIAAETGLTMQQSFWWVTALRKYNRVKDDKKRGDYMAYVRSGDAQAPANKEEVEA